MSEQIKEQKIKKLLISNKVKLPVELFTRQNF